MSKQAVVGILAHVDAGKTTLAEVMLFNAGRIRKRGRVDDGDSHLDTNAIERERGITIFRRRPCSTTVIPTSCSWMRPATSIFGRGGAHAARA